jgi:2-methylisocitrate lyase-like PEP mutase family enzyme
MPDVTVARAGVEDPGRRLRDLLQAPAILPMPGVYDGFSVRLVDSLGYQAAFITGSGVSESRYGQPDVGLMGLAENLECARMLASRTAMTLIADIDTGYGNPVNVHFATRAFEQAGVGAVMIEDQTWPKRCGHMAGKELIPADEMAMKVRSAADARRSADFVIGARTDAIATDGLAEAIRRANIYVDAGADLLFADALLSEDDIAAFVKAVHGPVLVNMGFGIRRRTTTPVLSARRLEELGVAAVIFPRLLTSAALAGMQRAMEALGASLASGEAVDRPDLCFSFEDLNNLMGFGAIRELENTYLTESELDRKYGSSQTATKS